MKLWLSRSVALCVCLFLSTQVGAYELTGFRWSGSVRYEINTGSSVELGRETTLTVVSDSYAAWSDPNCSQVSYRYEGETQGNFTTGDQINTLIWQYSGNRFPRELGGASTIGVTLSSSYGNQAIDGDIVFNGIDHRWVVGSSSYGQVDAQSIITHEVGHQLGLDHSPYQDATMYAAYLGGNGARTLSNDDIAGICSLYPSGAQADCLNDNQCGNGQRCVSGRCQAADQVEGGNIGSSCGPQSLCATGLFCVGTGPNDSFCTRQCGQGCPQGWDCTAVTFQNGQSAQICLEGQDTQVGTGEFGDPCEGGFNCRTGFCVGDQNQAFCSQSCRTAEDCPDGADCFPLQNGGGACAPSLDEPMVDSDGGGSVSPNDPSGGGQGDSTGIEPTQAEAAGADEEVVEFFPDSGGDDAGCACDQSSSAPPWLWFFFLLPLYALKPRSWA